MGAKQSFLIHCFHWARAASKVLVQIYGDCIISWILNLEVQQEHGEQGAWPRATGVRSIFPNAPRAVGAKPSFLMSLHLFWSQEVFITSKTGSGKSVLTLALVIAKIIAKKNHIWHLQSIPQKPWLLTKQRQSPLTAGNILTLWY